MCIAQEHPELVEDVIGELVLVNFVERVSAQELRCDDHRVVGGGNALKVWPHESGMLGRQRHEGHGVCCLVNGGIGFAIVDAEPEAIPQGADLAEQVAIAVEHADVVGHAVDVHGNIVAGHGGGEGDRVVLVVLIDGNRFNEWFGNLGVSCRVPIDNLKQG